MGCAVDELVVLMQKSLKVNRRGKMKDMKEGRGER